jgi:hypothetical protein
VPSFDILLLKLRRNNPRAKPKHTVCETVDWFHLVLYWLLLNTATKFWFHKSKGWGVEGVVYQLCDCQLLKAAYVLWN